MPFSLASCSLDCPSRSVGLTVGAMVADVLTIQAGTRFTEDELHDILAIIQQVFDEEEGNIPEGVEDVEMPKIANKLLGANKKKRKVKRKV